MKCKRVLGLWMLVMALWAVGCGEAGQGGDGVAGDGNGADGYARVLAEGLPRVDRASLERIVERTAAQQRVLVLDFWATWCGVCVAMFGEVHERVKGLGEDVRLVTVSLDASQEETRAINFLAEHGALGDAYMLRPDTGARADVERHLGERWRDLALPAILVFDVEGELAREFLGEEAQAEAIAAYVRELIRNE